MFLEISPQNLSFQGNNDKSLIQKCLKKALSREGRHWSLLPTHAAVISKEFWTIYSGSSGIICIEPVNSGEHLFEDAWEKINS